MLDSSFNFIFFYFKLLNNNLVAPPAATLRFKQIETSPVPEKVGGVARPCSITYTALWRENGSSQIGTGLTCWVYVLYKLGDSKMAISLS